MYRCNLIVPSSLYSALLRRRRNECGCGGDIYIYIGVYKRHCSTEMINFNYTLEDHGGHARSRFVCSRRSLQSVHRLPYALPSASHRPRYQRRRSLSSLTMRARRAAKYLFWPLRGGFFLFFLNFFYLIFQQPRPQPLRRVYSIIPILLGAHTRTSHMRLFYIHRLYTHDAYIMHKATYKH